jgi:arylsulfatase A-like enzyme
MKRVAPPLIRATFLVGIALGAAEAARVINGVKRVSTADFLLAFLYASLGYGLCGVFGALLWLLFKRNNEHEPADITVWKIAIGCATGSFLSIHFVLALVPFRTHWVLMLVPVCLLLAVVCGWVAARLSLIVPWLRKAWTWFAITIAVIIWTLFVAVFSHRDESRADGSAKNGPVNILLISVDTLRSDRLGCYGFKTASTPNIDRLAKQGILFEDATSPIPLTGPSHVTMLTGLNPWNHGVTANGVRLQMASTLPEMLSTSGYNTAAFISGWTLKNDSTNLASRFDHYDEDFAIWGGFPDIVLRVALPKLFVRAYKILTGVQIFRLERPAEITTGKAIAWLSRQEGNLPFFLFVHYFDPHEPHLPPSPFDRLHPAAAKGEHPLFGHDQSTEVRQSVISDTAKVDHIKALYDGEISYVDQQIGRLLQAVDRARGGKNVLVIFTADHGQSLSEHQSYFTHGDFLYETCVQVPLILRLPDGSHFGSRVSNQVRLADIMPTILSIVNLKSKIKLDGESLLPIIRGIESKSRISYGALHTSGEKKEHSRYFVKKDGFKLIWNYDRRKEISSAPASEEFYDLRNDPGELKNLALTSNPILESLRKLMLVHVQNQRHDAAIPDDDVREALESLGYL